MLRALRVDLLPLLCRCCFPCCCPCTPPR